MLPMVLLYQGQISHFLDINTMTITVFTYFLTVESLHKEFARAGSDVLQAFTYNANDRLDRVCCPFILHNPSARNYMASTV